MRKQTKTTSKITKRKKLAKTSVIRRRIMRKWSEKVRSSTDFRCAVCGMKNGEIINGKKQKVEAHHIVSRDIHNSAMKFELLNGIPLCTHHHKFGNISAHKNMVWFVHWLKNHRPLQYDFIIENHQNKIDLNNREILQQIEEKMDSPITEQEFAILNLKDMEDLESKKQYIAVQQDEKQDETQDETSIFDEFSEKEN